MMPLPADGKRQRGEAKLGEVSHQNEVLEDYVSPPLTFLTFCFLALPLLPSINGPNPLKRCKIHLQF